METSSTRGRNMVEKQYSLIGENGLLVGFDYTAEPTEFHVSVYEGGLHYPKWNGKEWVNAQKVIQSESVSLEQKVAEHDTKIVSLQEELDAIFGD